MRWNPHYISLCILFLEHMFPLWAEYLTLHNCSRCRRFWGEQSNIMLSTIWYCHHCVHNFHIIFGNATSFLILSYKRMIWSRFLCLRGHNFWNFVIALRSKRLDSTYYSSTPLVSRLTVILVALVMPILLPCTMLHQFSAIFLCRYIFICNFRIHSVTVLYSSCAPKANAFSSSFPGSCSANL